MNAGLYWRFDALISKNPGKYMKNQTKFAVPGRGFVVNL